MFSRVFATLRAKNTINTDVFGGSEASEAQNHGIYDFLASGSKNRSIDSIFLAAPSKNTGIYAGFTMLQDVMSISKRDKKLDINYNVLALLVGCVGGAEGGVLK